MCCLHNMQGGESTNRAVKKQGILCVLLHLCREKKAQTEMEVGKETVLMDVRNLYETSIGHFSVVGAEQMSSMFTLRNNREFPYVFVRKLWSWARARAYTSE